MRILDFADGFESSAAPTVIPFPASSVSVTPTGNLASTTAQAGLVELQGDIDTLNAKIGAPSGIASLDSGGKVPSSQLPALALVDVNAVANIAARDALTVQEGDVAVVADAGSGVSKTYIYDGSSWIELLADGTLAAHLSDTSGAHAASAISVQPTGSWVGDDGQEAIEELRDAVDAFSAGTAPSAPYELSNLGLACSVSSNALTIALKDASGADPSAGSPVKIGFRDSTLANGTHVQRSITSATSLTISSGSTLGHASGRTYHVYVYAIDTGSGVVLGASTVYYDGNASLYSTTAEGGAGGADSNRVIYSATAQTNKPIRCLGRLTVNQTTAGTWTSVPSAIALWPFDTVPIQVIYSNSSGTTFAHGTGGLKVPFPNVVQDTHNAVTTPSATWTFTSPKTTRFRMSIVLGGNSNNAWAGSSGEQYWLYMQVNGSNVAVYFDGPNITANTEHSWNFTHDLTLDAGDTVTVEMGNNSGGTLTLLANATWNRVSVTEVK